MRRAAAAPLAALLAAGLAACAAEPLSPEDEIRALLAGFEAAAEARDVAAAKDLVSEAYRDEQGNDKRAIKALLLRYFLGHEALYVLTRVRSIRLAQPPERAAVAAVAALSGAPVEEPGQLAGLRADLYRFDLQLVREADGRWRVASARWRPARPAELLPGGGG